MTIYGYSGQSERAKHTNSLLLFLNKSREGEGFKKRIIAFIPHISGYFLYILDKEDITVEMNRDCLIS